jgi:hypothetical protein
MTNLDVGAPDRVGKLRQVLGFTQRKGTKALTATSVAKSFHEKAG